MCAPFWSWWWWWLVEEEEEERGVRVGSVRWFAENGGGPSRSVSCVRLSWEYGGGGGDVVGSWVAVDGHAAHWGVAKGTRRGGTTI